MTRLRIVAVLAASLALAACGPEAPPRSAGQVAVSVGSTVDSVQAMYDGAKAFVELFLPLVPAARAAQIRAAGNVVEHLLFVARTGATLAKRQAALAEARRAVAAYQASSGG